MTISGFLFCLTAVMTSLNTSMSQPPLDPGEKPLPHHTRAVTKTVGWVRPYYVWRNKRTILIFRGDDEYGILQGLEEYHLDTGKHDTLAALNRRWLDNPLTRPNKDDQPGNQPQGGAIHQPTVSPDGKWIVWIAYRANVGGADGHRMMISLDGKHWTERLNDPQITDYVCSIVWECNSRSWI